MDRSRHKIFVAFAVVMKILLRSMIARNAMVVAAVAAAVVVSNVGTVIAFDVECKVPERPAMPVVFCPDH